MRLLVLGGTPAHPGGVEAFSERSTTALRRRTGWQVEHSITGTAYLSLRTAPGFLKGLARLVAYRRAKPDLVWIQYVNLADLTYVVLARALGMRVMVTPHLGVNWRSQRHVGLRNLSRRILGLANRIALISRTQEEEIALPAFVKRSDIRNFLSAELLATALPVLPPDGTPLRLVHSGRLSEGKGTFLFVEVCGELRRAGIPFSAVITGGADEDTMRRLAKTIADQDVSDQIRVAGRVTEDELHAVLNDSDVLLHLSRIDSYPLIVLEALALGAYPICLDLAGARDMVTAFAGEVVPDSDPVRDAARVLATRDTKALRKEALEGAVAVRQAYSWDASAGLLERAVKSSV